MKKLILIGLLTSAAAGLFSSGLPTTEARIRTNELQASDGARRIPPADLRPLVKKNQAIIVDVRSAEAYKGSHIKGAISIPFSEIGNRAGELPRDKLIATYCS